MTGFNEVQQHTWINQYFSSSRSYILTFNLNSEFDLLWNLMTYEVKININTQYIAMNFHTSSHVMYKTTSADMKTLCSIPFFLPSAYCSHSAMNLRGSLCYYYYVTLAVLAVLNHYSSASRCFCNSSLLPIPWSVGKQLCVSSYHQCCDL